MRYNDNNLEKKDKIAHGPDELLLVQDKIGKKKKLRQEGSRVEFHVHSILFMKPLAEITRKIQAG